MVTKYTSFTKKPLSNAIIVILLTNTYSLAIAQDTPHVELDTIVTVGTSSTEEKNKDITGLGKIKKTAETLKKNQVEGIRDLTRYDPGVAINESVGRGTSTGFSIRGAEKERVSVMVDGISQGESIKRPTSYTDVSSGAKNEVEYENLKLVEINKGVNSTYAGSGALGGAVLMQTKDAQDFLTDGKELGGRVKLGYTSKDKRKMASVALAGRKNGWEGFIQYTKRQGHEIQPHKDVYNLPATTVNHVITGFDENKLIEVELPNGESYSIRPSPDFIPNTETINFSADEVSGPERRVPNPMDYDSSSILSKIGYHFTPEHYVGAVFEDTKQTYDIRNMFKYQYHNNKFNRINSSNGINPPILESEVTRKEKDLPSPLYQVYIADFYRNTPASFLTDIHHNRRQGLEYKYTPATNSIIDELKANFDIQKLSLSSNDELLNCSKWPTVDRHCGVSKVGDYTKKVESLNKFDSKRLQLETKKNFQIGKTSHDLSISTGYKNVVFDGSQNTQKKAISRYLDKRKETAKKNETKEIVYVYDGALEKLVPRENFTIKTSHRFDFLPLSEESFKPFPADITNTAYHIGLNDNIHLTDKLGMTLGLRYDSNKLESDLSKITSNKSYTRGLPVFPNSHFKNTSYNLGLSYFPINDLELTYKFSTGFRIPSFSEQLGVVDLFKDKDDLERGDVEVQPALKAETAKNQEFGVTYYTDFGSIKGSYFKTDYDDFIDLAEITEDKTAPLGYANYQNVKIHGFDISSQFDLNALWNKLPFGLQAHASAGMVKMLDKDSIHSLGKKFNYTRGYALDMVQPLRIIYGLSYNEPSDKWGIAINNTYSAAKNPDENDQERKTSSNTDSKPTSVLISPSWRITDLTGHYRINDKITLRGGIYNLFDYRYLTWEAIRQNEDFKEFQSSKDNTDLRLLAAPGRNYGLSMEFVF